MIRMLPKVWFNNPSAPAGFIALEASTPVSNIPTIPPTPWQGKTSNVSSKFDFDLKCTAILEQSAATVPIKILEPTDTNPAAGVMATKPTTAPMQAPKAEGFLPTNPSKKIQVIMAAADAVFVVKNACAAISLAPNAEPALNPNQPNQSMPVPNITNGIFAGACVCLLMCCALLPKTMAPAKAAKPAAM